MNTIDRETTKQQVAEVFAEIPNGFAIGFYLFDKLVKITNNSANRLQLSYVTPENEGAVDVAEYIQQLHLDSPVLCQAVFEQVFTYLPEVDFMNAQNVFMLFLAFKDLEQERMDALITRARAAEKQTQLSA